MTTGQEGDKTTRIPMIHGLDRAQRQHDQQTPRESQAWDMRKVRRLLWEAHRLSEESASAEACVVTELVGRALDVLEGVEE